MGPHSQCCFFFFFRNVIFNSYRHTPITQITGKEKVSILSREHLYKRVLWLTLSNAFERSHKVNKDNFCCPYYYMTYL